jgi:hypothetical protein
MLRMEEKNKRPRENSHRNGRQHAMKMKESKGTDGRLGTVIFIRLFNLDHGLFVELGVGSLR